MNTWDECTTSAEYTSMEYGRDDIWLGQINLNGTSVGNQWYDEMWYYRMGV